MQSIDREQEPAESVFEPAGAGGRNRTADLPLTRRLLCQLSYAGLLHEATTVYWSGLEGGNWWAALMGDPGG